jgi:hypothetical protein
MQKPNGLFIILIGLNQFLLHFFYVSAIFAVSSLVFRFRTKSLRRSNLILKQRDRLARDIKKQKEILHLRNKEIEDSLNYARGIQKAMLINHKQFREILPDSFIVHKSKDIVSGDFYWISRLEDKIIIAAVDCTGHGVPGAFMSLIGFEFFRKIINTQNIHQADKILAALNTNLFEIFKNEERTILRDGMDLALCILYKDQNCLDFVGSFCPLYLIRENSILEIRGDHFPIGAEFSDDSLSSILSPITGWN